MSENVKKAIEKYQCAGCINGYDISCFKSSENCSCENHVAGTIISNIGKILLGMPKGFNRLGEFGKLKPEIYENLNKYDGYDKLNIPVWKHLTPDGHTLVRGIMPRRNEPFIHVFLENCIDKINCLEIMQSDINAMD